VRIRCALSWVAVSAQILADGARKNSPTWLLEDGGTTRTRFRSDAMKRDVTATDAAARPCLRAAPPPPPPLAAAAATF